MYRYVKFLCFVAVETKKNEQVEDENDDKKADTENTGEPAESPAQDPQEQKLVNIIIKDLNGREIKLKVSCPIASTKH